MQKLSVEELKSIVRNAPLIAIDLIPARGVTVRLDAAYHRYITNAFQDTWKWRWGRPSLDMVKKIMIQVYTKYPLPPGYTYYFGF